MNDAVVAVIIFVVIPLVLIERILIASEFYRVACMKGHGEMKYYAFVLLFGITGCLLVTALPNVNEYTTKINNKKINNLPEL